MSGSTIGFEEIPLDWRVPGTYLEIRPDRRRGGLLPFPARTLLVAPKLAAGSGATGVPLPVTRLDEVVTSAGAGSIAAEMAEMFLRNNATGAVSMLLLDDPAGGAAHAQGSITFSGTPTAPGEAVVLVGGRRVSVPVSAGDLPATLANRLVAAIGAQGRMAATATAAAGVMTLQARHAGAVGNHLPIVVAPEPRQPLPPGLQAAVTPMAGGTGEADYAGALLAIAADWWTDLVFPLLSPGLMAMLPAELDRRFTALTRLDSHAWGFLPGSFGTLSGAGSARNGRFITEMGAHHSPSPPWAWAAALAGRAAFHLLGDPARQLRGLPLLGILPPPPAARFIDAERDLLLRDGISTFTATADDAVVIERVISQHQRTPLGVEDTAWLDVMAAKTLTRIRHDWVGHMNATWPRAKLADDGSPAAEYDLEIATPRRLHASWAARCVLYERMGWIQEASRTSARSLFARDANDRNRVNARQYVNLLGNLVTLAGVLEFEQ